MKNKIERLKIRINQGLLSKNLKLKQEIKQLKQDKVNLKKEKEELYDLINIQKDDIRQLDLKQRKMKDILQKSELFNDLVEILGDKENE